MSDTVWVVSWVYWNGDEQGGGGFWWYPDRDDAFLAFEEEKRAWATAVARVRLIKVDLPPEARVKHHHLYGGSFSRCSSDSPETCWIDERIEGPEGEWPAELVWINPPGKGRS